MNAVLKSLITEMLEDTDKDDPDTLQEYYDKAEAVVKDIIGVDEPMHLYGSKKQLSMTEEDVFENDLAIARNWLRKEQRERLES